MTRGVVGPALDARFAQNLAVAVGGHHGTFPANWDGLCDVLGNDQWAAARHHILGELARRFGIATAPTPKRVEGNDQSVWMVLAGLTSVADWVGSNVAFFPPFVTETRAVDAPFDVDDYFHNSGVKADDALKRLGWLDRAEPTGKVATFQQATTSPVRAGCRRRSSHSRGADDDAPTHHRRSADGRGEDGGGLVRRRLLGPPRRCRHLRRLADDGDQQPDVRAGRERSWRPATARRT